MHRESSTQVYVMMGPQGCGKGTVSKMIQKLLNGANVLVLTCSDCIKETARANHPYATKFQVTEKMRKGLTLMCSSIIFPLREKMDQILNQDIVILDGFARSKNQVRILNEEFGRYKIIPHFIHLDCPDEVAKGRIEIRKKIENREDDKCPEALNTRFKIFHKNHRHVMKAIYHHGLPVYILDAKNDPRTIASQVIMTTRMLSVVQ